MRIPLQKINILAVDITIIIPTHNRAEILRITLDGMSTLDFGSYAVEFVIVDNASKDHTKSIIDSFMGRIPIRYLFEPQPGKNKAINCALDNTPLGNIVVFTDDDVDVKPDWLISIIKVCEHWPDNYVFGGRIKIVWPHEDIPNWAHNTYIQAIGFTYHDYSNQDCVYEKDRFPCGPNFWVRREVFSNGRRFDETVGPHPTRRTLSDETLFLMALQNDGYRAVYSPQPVVGHRIHSEVLTVKGIYRRAYHLGRGLFHFELLKERTNQKLLLYPIHHLLAIVWRGFRLVLSILSFDSKRRVQECVNQIRDIAYHIEAIYYIKDMIRTK